MRLSRDLIIVLLLLVVVVALTGVLGARQAEAEQAKSNFTSLSSHSAAPEGALALYNWLDGLGYRTARVEGDIYSLDNSARALFVLSTRENFTPGEANAVIQWVERGNTLILCDSSPRSLELWKELKAGMAGLATASGDLPVEQPIRGDTPVNLHVSTFSSITLNRNDYVTYLSDRGEPLIVTFQQGQGRVWLCTVPGLFSNQGLAYDGNAAMVGAMLSNVPRGSLVLFDEFHIDYGRPTPSLQSLLVQTPWGWAVILTFAVLFGYVIVNGRRFGRVMPLPQDIVRRSPAEYVTSMARLFRRGDKRAMALKHYRQQLKRRLGRPYALNPDMPDDRFVEALAKQRENLDQQALLQTLRGLDQKRVDDRTLVKLAAQAAAFTNRSNDTQVK